MATKGDGTGESSGGLFDDLPEPEYDHLALSYIQDEDEDDDEDSLGKPSKKKSSGDLKKTAAKKPLDPPYILGTLIVRVVAARDLTPARNRHGLGDFLFGGGGKGGGGGGTANPYASVKFGSSTQRTPEVFDTLDPVWPRGETMFMDVSLPLSKTTHPDPTAPEQSAVPDTTVNITSEHNYSEEGTPILDTTASFSSSSSSPLSPSHAHSNHLDSTDLLDVPDPILTVAVFHSEAGKAKSVYGDNDKYNPKKSGAQFFGDSDDDFLGMASVDLTSLLTGKRTLVDTWLPLAGASVSNRDRGSSIRIVCEYETSDVAPSPGDLVKFSRFCHPADLYPLVPGRTYLVQEVIDQDHILLSYTSPEGWLCSFVAHRFMVMCTERHHNAVEVCREEWQSLTDRLSYSPLVGTVAETVDRLPDEGLITLGANAIQGGASLLGRWFEEGVGTAMKDVVFATNWDGRFNPNTVESLSNRNSNNNNSSAQEDGSAITNNNTDTQENGDSSQDAARSEALANNTTAKIASGSSKDPLPNMPSCPITGEPMLDPVVAADGHTYERSAIARWLQSSDKSPLTGSTLPHKELVPNYGLLSSLEEQAETLYMNNAASTNHTEAKAVKANVAEAVIEPEGDSDAPDDGDATNITLDVDLAEEGEACPQINVQEEEACSQVEVEEEEEVQDE